jgi:hypothetical protein
MKRIEKNGSVLYSRLTRRQLTRLLGSSVSALLALSADPARSLAQLPHSPLTRDCNDRFIWERPSAHSSAATLN